MTFSELHNKVSSLINEESKRVIDENIISAFNSSNNIIPAGSPVYASNQFGNYQGVSIMGVTPSGSMSEHFGLVRDFRKKFTQYTKEEFRELSNKPMIKDILKGGVTKLNKEQIAQRIKEHLEDK